MRDHKGHVLCEFSLLVMGLFVVLPEIKLSLVDLTPGLFSKPFNSLAVFPEAVLLLRVISRNGIYS